MARVPAVTLIRVFVPRARACTYVAVYAAEALPILARLGAALDEVSADLPAGAQPGDVDVNTMPWDILPGVRAVTAAYLAQQDRKTVALIGTVVDGQWTKWNPPVPPPPPPPDLR